ncbi:MAG: SIS domain-containing protein [Desulfomonilia bacterium]
MNASRIIELGKEAVRIEIEGLEELASQIGEGFAQAVTIIADLKGKVVLTGVGKSGIIAKKIASTMMSIGTPAIFMHPVDGLHGDLGSIVAEDAAIIITNSGKTTEVINLIPSLKKLSIPIITITSDMDSTAALASDVVLKCSVSREACNLGLAPTASTTAQLALGDAIAVVVSQIKGFDKDSFNILHPAGELGKQLMVGISQMMITGERIPVVSLDTPLSDVVREMTQKKLGFTLVKKGASVEGMITDGDLRRVLLRHGDKLAGLKAKDIMSPKPKGISVGKLAIDALDIMEKSQITSLVVTDESDTMTGVIHLHDLLGRGKLGLR